MSDEAALLSAILAHPDEDTPRLMYADWLEEHGQPERAEFIRVQIEITRVPEVKRRKQPRRERLAMFRELLASHGAEWVRPLGVERTRVIFRRGLIEDIRFTDAELLRVTNSALSQEPLFNVAVASESERLQTLGDAVMQRLASWVTDGRLRTLRLEDLVFSPSAVKAFVDSPAVKCLRVLDLASCVFPSEVVRVLSESESLTELVELHLGLRDLAAADVLALAQAPLFPKLQTVQLVASNSAPGLKSAMRRLESRLRK